MKNNNNLHGIFDLFINAFFTFTLLFFTQKIIKNTEIIDIKFKTTATINILTFESLVLALKRFNTTSNSDICKNIEIILVFFIMIKALQFLPMFRHD